MTYEFWITAGLFSAAVFFLVADVPVKPKDDHGTKNKRRASTPASR